ncbi:NADPH:quinone reductase [Luteococcus peritonei]|uniref:NADPH:quinone reductase n=1 Tax=Luteococcus peritonei TaxID=88874 RepID=A0ABW4RVS7_9ACTN
MRAVWYERQGPAAEVLQVGELADPEPADGEVRVRVLLSGVNPGDVRKREDSFGHGMAHPRVVPHSDGMGVVDRVGPGVDPARLGSRVWLWGAQSYRAFGTAADLVVVPEHLAVALPDEVDDELAACLGIPGITAHRCILGDGPVAGRTVLVHGLLGGVASMAAALARRDGATVIGTVRRTTDLAEAEGLADHVVALDDDPAGRVRSLAPRGVDRVVEVALAANLDLDRQVLAQHGVISAYASDQPEVVLPFWPMLFDNLSLRLVGSDDFTPAQREAAVADLTAAAAEGWLRPRIAEPLPLEQCARAHDLVAAGSRERQLLRVQQP